VLYSIEPLRGGVSVQPVNLAPAAFALVFEVTVVRNDLKAVVVFEPGVVRTIKTVLASGAEGFVSKDGPLRVVRVLVVRTVGRPRG